MSARVTQARTGPAPERGRTVRALLAILAALFIAFDVACLSALGFLIVGQTLGYLSLLGWTHMMAVVGAADAILFFVVLGLLFGRWRHGHRRGHMAEIALITAIAGGAAFLLGNATLLALHMALIAVSDPSAWDLEQLLPAILDWL